MKLGVVIAHYNQPRELAWVAQALRRSSYDIAGVVIADDGSVCAPEPLAGISAPSRVVTGPDRGFRAAAARNAGARELLGMCEPDAICFLDADTAPEPEFFAEIASELSTADLVVGRRRYGDLATGVPPSTRYEEPEWLTRGYTETSNLRDADARSYRYVISACLAVKTGLWQRIGGFDARFVGYGGEDWDLARRAYLAGADMAYAERAVCWHHGPDAGARNTPAQAKNTETLAVAARITDPLVRGAGAIYDYPRILVCVEGPLTTAELAAIATPWLTEDARIYAPSAQASPFARDPRIALRHPGAAEHGRAEFVVRLRGAARLAAQWSQVEPYVPHGAPLRCDGATIWRTRDLHRTPDAEPVDARPDRALFTQVHGEPNLQARWGWQGLR